MNDKKAIILYSIIGLIVIFSTLVTSALLMNKDSDHSEDTSKAAITTEVQGNVTFTFMNSGEGMASVIETSKGGIAVIDTGTGENPFLQDYIQGRKVDQTPENATKMLLSDDLKYSGITGIVAAKNGGNAYFCSDLLRKHPKFVVANITENNDGNNQLTTYCKENNTDLYTFVANPMIPLHFSSSGNEMRLVGFE